MFPATHAWSTHRVARWPAIDTVVRFDMGDGGGDDEVDKKALKFSFNQGSNSTKRRKRDTVAGVSFADDGDGGSDDDGGPGKKGPQQITSFDGQASQENAGAANARRLLTIPAQPNTYREGKRYVPSFVPEQIKTEELEDMKPGDGIVKFESGTVVGEEKPGDGGTYGLELRKVGGHAGAGKQERQRDATRQRNDINYRQSEREAREAEALLGDLQHLPPESTVEEYQRMPVEAFGEALLRGMGWKEGRGIGRGKKDVDAKELVRRADRLGLGADPAAVNKKEKRFIKPGESRQAHQEEMVYVDEKTGVIKASRPVGSDAKLRKRSEMGVVAGKRMYVAGGKHSGFLCEVREVEQADERATVRLIPSMETVKVPFRDLAEVGGRGGRGDAGSDGNGAAEGPAPKKARMKDTASLVPVSSARPWLYPNIRVRIVDKKASNGRYYLKKGTVVDVKTPETCDIFIDDFREVAQDLHQRQLETVVPKVEGSPLLCVSGKWKGRQGTLLRRNKKTDYIACQLEDEEEVLKLHLDDVCELVVG